MTLITNRLILRPFHLDDYEAVHAYASNYENVKHMIWGPNSEEDTKRFLTKRTQTNKVTPRTDYDFAVTLHDGKLIGGCAIYCDAVLKSATLGWVLHMDYWRQGFGSEIAAELLRFGFEDLKLHRITAACNTDNYGSYRVMERNGMRREAHFLKCQPGRACDAEEWYGKYLYAMLESEWQAKN